MKKTDQTLVEQMQITDFEIEHRKALFSFTGEGAKLLFSCKKVIEENIDSLVSEFYQMQTNLTENTLLIGDSDTLFRLKAAQRRYIMDLFSGVYDLEYVNNRLRIGLVHKRIGVEPKLYLSAVLSLQDMLHRTIVESTKTEANCAAILEALDKLLLFDITLVFEMYIWSLVYEIKIAKDKTEQYAHAMEEKVKERTHQLEEMSRTDALTELLNVRHLDEILTTVLRGAQRRNEPVTAIYMDVNDFKMINDIYGHLRGDEVLRTVGKAIKNVTRMEDKCFRYGGDEFLVILANCNEDQADKLFSQRFEQQLNKALDDVTLSVGIAQTGPDQYVDARALINLADEKMFAEKQALKKKIEAPEPSL